MNLQVLGILLLVTYLLGMIKFLMGFRNTFYENNALGLAIFWPVLFIVNGNYRREFFKALKG